jgi:hypothetical protein
MKILLVPLGIFVLSAPALAAQATQDRPQDPSSMEAQPAPRNPASLDEQQRKSEVGGKQMSGEVVSVDAQGKTITLTKTSGTPPAGSPGSPQHSLPGTAAETKTLTVEGAAAASLSTIRKGDKVMLTCRPATAGTFTGAAPTGAGPAVAEGDCPAVTTISKLQ